MKIYFCTYKLINKCRALSRKLLKTGALTEKFDIKQVACGRLNDPRVNGDEKVVVVVCVVGTPNLETTLLLHVDQFSLTKM